VESNVEYCQVNGETVDQVGIGGIIGWLRSGSADGIESEAGSITLAEGGKVTNEHMYAIGGAVGYAEANMRNITVETVIDPAWAGSLNWASAETFGSSGIANNGALGMFVGYAGAVTIENCTSTEATNETFQFLGEAALSTKDVNSDLWFSDSSHSTLETMSEDEVTSGSVSVQTANNENVVLNSVTDSSNKVNYVVTELVNCTFVMNKEVREQITGYNTYFYELGQTGRSEYRIGTPVTVSTGDGTLSYTVSKNTSAISDKQATSSYYRLDNGSYTRVYVSSIRKE
jgi:hypothetical protein